MSAFINATWLVTERDFNIPPAGWHGLPVNETSYNSEWSIQDLKKRDAKGKVSHLGVEQMHTQKLIA